MTVELSLNTYRRLTAFVGGDIVESSNDPCRRRVWSGLRSAICEIGADDGGRIMGAADCGHEKHQYQCKHDGLDKYSQGFESMILAEPRYFTTPMNDQDFSRGQARQFDDIVSGLLVVEGKGNTE